MSNELLGRALGHALSQLDGLSAAYLPDAVTEATAQAIVRCANGDRTIDPPFAILVEVGLENLDDSKCLRLTPQSAIRYRQDDRLAVVRGRHPDLASFVQAFREVLGQAYPAAAQGVTSLDSLSKFALQEVLDLAGVVPAGDWQSAEAEVRLANCISNLRDAYEELRQGARGWNAYWFDHVTLGLENLSMVLSAAAASSTTQTLDQFFERYTWASFSLPTPKSGLLLMPPAGRVGKAIVDALANWWSDEQIIGITVQQLAHHPDTLTGSGHPLAEVDWIGFDRTLAETDNQLLSILRFTSTLQNIERFAALTVPQFFDPLLKVQAARQLEIYGAEGQDLAAATNANLGPFVLRSSRLTPTTIRSESVRVAIPIIALPSEDQVLGSNLTLTCSAARVSWTGSLELEGDSLWFSGHFSRDTIVANYTKPFISCNISVSFKAEDSLAGVVNPSASCLFYLLPHVGVGLMFMRANARGQLGRATYVGTDVSAVADSRHDSVYPATFDDSTSKYQVIMWGEESDGGYLESKPLSHLKGRAGLWGAALRPRGLDAFESGTSLFELRSPEPKNSCQSPLVGAVDNQLISADRPSPTTELSVRGRLENLLADNVQNPEWELALGHIVLPADLDIPIEGVSPRGAGLLMSDEMYRSWSATTRFKVPESFVESDEAVAFRSAFRELGVAEAIMPILEGATVSPEWPSRTSWKHLWSRDRDTLDGYLSAYTALILAARKLNDPASIFWASYPFSASIWDAGTSGKCVAVMLSPLHPLRLAWLASAESTLWEAPDAPYLAGTLEGWNLPLIGPRETRNGRMVAIPTDSGEGQVFLGWSMLVGASIDGEESLKAPVKVGNLAAPGSAASGLNATAASAALRSYRNMHPHVSTLSIDLSASSPSSRLAEVDDAVLAAVQDWTTSKSSFLRGGARIWDSLNRGGEAPRQAISKLIGSASGSPITWARYQPDPQAPRRSNVRMLQDAGVRIEVGESPRPNLGILGKVPLRRFEAFEAPHPSSASSESRPALQSTDGWTAFGTALSEIENAAARPRLTSKLFNSELVDDKADWTVSGEALMSPSAMAALVNDSGASSQMLWEWRPPFLEAAEGVPVLERRPFVSIARVPGSFRHQVRSLLDKANEHPATEESVSQLLRTLGSRGVGLSSLISMGGTHAAGALGFYLTFSLMESARTNDCDEFVLPIDACDTFLKALAGDFHHGETTRRADLLVVRLDDKGLTLTPIEIKFYGLIGPEIESHLPKPGDAAFIEPLSQLASTFELLAKLQRRWHELKDGNPASRALWLNGLTALVEAGARLRPHEAQSAGQLTEKMAALAAGALNVRIGRPIVTYFRHRAHTLAGDLFGVHLSQSAGAATTMGEYGSLASNVATAFEQAKQVGSPLAQAWSSLLSWSASAATESGSVEAGSVTLQQQPDPLASEPKNEPEDAANDSLTVTTSVSPTSSGRHGALVVEGQMDVAPPDSKSPTPLAVEDADGVKFSIGRVLNAINSGSASYWPSNTALTQMNVGVVGDLGTGKTQLLKSLIYNLRAEVSRVQTNPLSILIFDYKRDFQDREFLDAVGGDVLLPQGIPLNIFALPNGYSPLAAFQKAKAFCDVIGKIYSGVGPVQRDRLVTVITQLFKERNGRPPTLAQVSDAYRDGIKADSVVGILNTFVLGEVFSDDPDALVGFGELLRNKVLVLAVSALGADQDSKNALVALFLNMYYEYMLSAQKWPYKGTSPQLRILNSFLLVDEAVNIMRYEFPALMDLMLQGREFGFGTILASQYLSHFRTSNVNYGEPLLTWFIHKVPNVSPKELDQLGVRGQTTVTASKIGEQGVHEALYSSLGYQGTFVRGTPFYEILNLNRREA